MDLVNVVLALLHHIGAVIGRRKREWEGDGEREVEMGSTEGILEVRVLKMEQV